MGIDRCLGAPLVIPITWHLALVKTNMVPPSFLARPKKNINKNHLLNYTIFFFAFQRSFWRGYAHNISGAFHIPSKHVTRWIQNHRPSQQPGLFDLLAMTVAFEPKASIGPKCSNELGVHDHSWPDWCGHIQLGRTPWSKLDGFDTDGPKARNGHSPVSSLFPEFIPAVSSSFPSGLPPWMAIAPENPEALSVRWVPRKSGNKHERL